ncbi:MAG: OmpA family protein [Paracoccaceae bacterium]
MFVRLTFALGICLASPLFADPVRMTSDDGHVVVEGELLARDGELFRIMTEFGPVTIDGGTMSCSGAGCPDPADLVATARVAGPAELSHRLFPALLEGFADRRNLSLTRVFKDDQNVSWQLQTAETDRLVAVFDVSEAAQVRPDALLDEAVSIVFAYSEAPSGLRQDIVALDGIAPAVAPENPRAMLTLEQLQSLLSGETASWARLGGDTTPVSLHVSTHTNGVFKSLTVDTSRSDVVIHESDQHLADAVAGDPSALGLVPYASLGNAVPLVISGACGLATPATRDTIRAEDYPFTRPIFMIRHGADQPKLVREFMAFARSAQAQPLVRASGFIDQAIGQISFERQGNRIANAVLSAGRDPDAVTDVQNMIAVLLDASRLTLTFRFQDGSTDLDAQSVSNIQRLADAVSEGMFDGLEVLFVGFSDGAGEPDANLRLSERRARAVRRAVMARVTDGSAEFGIAAFGELMPMACDETPWGGRVNRRVEVWVKPLEISR